MATHKLASCLMASATFAVAQGAGAVGLPDISNAHTGKFLEEKDNFSQALSGGTPDLSLRLRYENVSDDIPATSPLAGTGDANLLSLRTDLGYSTARYNGFFGRVEFEAVTPIGDDKALNLNGDLTFPPGPVGSQVTAGHSIIPDNRVDEINEAYIGWRSAHGCPNAPGGCDGKTTVKMGRQTIIYDNHRWVGDIVWRQNHQSYDAFRIDNSSIENLSMSYVYLVGVNRAFGEYSVFNKFEMDTSHLINIAYTTPVGKLVAYGYLLNFDDNPRTPFPEGVGAVGTPGIANFDSDTWGLRFTGKQPYENGFTLLYELEWANQKPTNDAGPTLTDNDYTNIEFGGAFDVGDKPMVVKLGIETLGGNGVNAVQTPLATIHAFNGWADKFIGAPGGTNTPAGGLVDTSLTIVVAKLVGPSKLVFQYHDYKADTVIGGLDNYGTEWGLLFAKPFTKEWLAGVKYASFKDGDDGFSVDTDKYWVFGQYQFQ